MYDFLTLDNINKDKKEIHIVQYNIDENLVCATATQYFHIFIHPDDLLLLNGSVFFQWNCQHQIM